MSAFVYFGKPINSDTAAALVHAVKSLAGENDAQGKPRTEMSLSFASGGGDIIAALGAYNEIKRIPLRFSTHNAGAVNSATILPFLVGKVRTASPMSGFFFHQVQWGFPSQSGLQTTLVNEATTLMEHYTDMVASIVSQESKLKKDQVRTMMRDGTLVTPPEALKMGLVHKIDEPQFPLDGRSWQV